MDWAAGIVEALRILSDHQIALVISEVRVGSTGITPLLKLLKRHNPHLVTIVLTARRDSGMLVALINQGQIFRFLPKPLRRVLLGMGIRAGLQRCHSLQAAPGLTRRNEVEEVRLRSERDRHLAERIMGLMKRLARPA